VSIKSISYHWNIHLHNVERLLWRILQLASNAQLRYAAPAVGQRFELYCDIVSQLQDILKYQRFHQKIHIMTHIHGNGQTLVVYMLLAFLQSSGIRLHLKYIVFEVSHNLLNVHAGSSASIKQLRTA
jgi:hypothetical protein